MKRAGKGTKAAKAALKTKADLVNFTSTHGLPESPALMDPGIMYTVDLAELHDDYDCTGLTLICLKNVNWIKQLVEMPLQWQLHGDGKHKLHHGKWILVTFGTHCLSWDDKSKCYRHSFR